MDPAVIRSALERFEIDYLPTQTHIVIVLRLDIDDSFLDFTT